ncbi:MAG: O-antigen ligase family protein [Candidatus Tyrphobacter sp.]
MRRLEPLLACVIALVALAASASSAQAAFANYPEGISSRDVVGGLYAAGQSGWCCWIGAKAKLSIPVPARANAVIVTILIPSYAAKPGGTAIEASFDGVRVSRVCCFGEGTSQVAFNLPRTSAVNRRVLLELTPSTHFVPKALGMNGDERVLSVLLSSVVVENMVSGERYLDGAPRRVRGINEFGYRLLLILVGVVTLALTLRRRAFAWVALLVTSPFGLSAIAALGAIVALVVRRSNWRALAVQRRLWLVALAFVLFVISVVVSGLRAQYRHAAAAELVNVLAYLVTFYAAVRAFRSDPDRDLLRVWLGILTAVVAGIALLQPWYGATESRMFFGHDVVRVAGLLEGPNQLGAFLGLSLPLLFSLALGRRLRGIDTIAFLLGGAAVLLTFSRAGILACLLACILVVVLRMRRRAVVFVIVALVWIGAGLVTVHDATLPSSARQGIDDYNGGLGTRPALWHGALQMWHTQPALGIGPGNYELRISRYAPGVRTHANGYYLQLLAEQGIVGLVFYALLVLATIVALASRRNALAIGVLAVVIAFAFHQLVDGLLIYPKIGDLYWTLVGIGV